MRATAPSVAEARHAALASELDRLVAVLSAAGVLRVIVYGSFVRGTTGARSDLDLLVVVPEDGLSFVARLARFYALMQPALPCDLLAYTEAELPPMAAASDLVADALREGRVVYVRSAPPGV